MRQFRCKYRAVKPKGFIPSALLVNTYGKWFDWFEPLQAYKLLTCFSPLPCSVLFYQTGTLLQATGSKSLILLVVSQQISHLSLHAFHAPLPCSILPPETLSRASFSSRSLCLYCWNWQIFDRNKYE